MRERDLPAPAATGTPRGSIVHDGTTLTGPSDELWAIDATACLPGAGGGDGTAFVIVDDCTRECPGAHAARSGTRLEAIERLHKAIRMIRRHDDGRVVEGVILRYGHGSPFVSDAFQAEPGTTGIRSSPSFVRQPEGNGWVERCIRTPQRTVPPDQPARHRRAPESLALRDCAHRFHNHWIVGRLGDQPPTHSTDAASSEKPRAYHPQVVSGTGWAPPAGSSSRACHSSAHRTLLRRSRP